MTESELKRLIADLHSRTLVIPGSTRRIEPNSMGFQVCREILIEEGVEEIGGWAFTCSSVSTATIPSTVRIIEENPFPHTHILSVKCLSPHYSVRDFILIENATMRLVSYVGPDHFISRSNIMPTTGDSSTKTLQQYTIPPYIRVLGEGCFRGRNLFKIIIPPTVEKILQNPFVECPAIVINNSPNYSLNHCLLIETATRTLIAYVGHDTDITIPAGVEIIEASAFELLEYGDISITLPDSIREIHDIFCEGCNLKHIYVPGDKVEFFCSLIPQFKSIIGPVENKCRQTQPEQASINLSPLNAQITIPITRNSEHSPTTSHTVLPFTSHSSAKSLSLSRWRGIACLATGGALAYFIGCLSSCSLDITRWNTLAFNLAIVVAVISIITAIIVGTTTRHTTSLNRRIWKVFTTNHHI